VYSLSQMNTTREEARTSPSGLLALINDPRDLPFVRLSLAASLVMIPFAAILYVPGVFRWWLAAAYLVTNVAFFLDRFILMLHNTSHRALYKPRYRLLNLWIPWVLGPFFGETPDAYYAHHIGMHHPENNQPTDLSSTMSYQRDNALSFLAYYFRFMFLGIRELTAYLRKMKREKLRRRFIAGESGFYVVVTLLMFLNWRATCVIFVGPVIVVRFLMLAGNWAQHAFVCKSDPASPYLNSITCINCRYNDRCFNDGYHIGHHIKANRHWTEMRSDFESNTSEYAKQNAIVFEGIDFFGVWMRLMVKNYKSLAKHYVALGDHRPSEDEIIHMLRTRAQITEPMAESVDAIDSPAVPTA
jgi:hypothetical protein